MVNTSHVIASVPTRIPTTGPTPVASPTAGSTKGNTTYVSVQRVAEISIDRWNVR